jgi:hypothetical protein
MTDAFLPLLEKSAAPVIAETDQQVIGGSGANGEVLGIQLTPGITTIAASAIDIQHVDGAIANAVQTIHSTRFAARGHRHAPAALGLVPEPARRLPAAAVFGHGERPDERRRCAHRRGFPADRWVMHGLPVVTDPNIPVGQGTGNNEDPLFVVRASDLVLREGGIRARVLPETEATTLTVLLQIYSYLAFTAARYPQSVVEITGLSAPAW